MVVGLCDLSELPHLLTMAFGLDFPIINVFLPKVQVVLIFQTKLCLISWGYGWTASSQETLSPGLGVGLTPRAHGPDGSGIGRDLDCKASSYFWS